MKNSKEGKAKEDEEEEENDNKNVKAKKEVGNKKLNVECEEDEEE